MAVDKTRHYIADDGDDDDEEDYVIGGELDEDEDEDEVAAPRTEKTVATEPKIDDIQVEVLSDPNAPRWRTDPAEALKAEDNDRDYASRVKKKIAKMTAAGAELERRRQHSDAQLAETVAYATAQSAEVARLREELERRTATGYSSEVQSATNEADLATREFAAAAANGDAEGMAAAQKKMSAAQVRAAQFKVASDAATARGETAKAKTAAETARAKEAEQLRNTATQPTVPANPKLASWYAKNSWFDPKSKDDKSAYAIYLHNSLLAKGTQEGSDEYFEAVDSGLRRKYPKFFGVSKGGKTVRSERTDRTPDRESNDPQWHNPIQGNKLVFTRGQKDAAERLGLKTNNELMAFAKQIVRSHNEKEGRD